MTTERSLPAGHAANALRRQMSRTSLNAGASAAASLIRGRILGADRPWFRIEQNRPIGEYFTFERCTSTDQCRIVGSVGVRGDAYPKAALKRLERHPTRYEPKVDEVVLAVMEQAKVRTRRGRVHFICLTALRMIQVMGLVDSHKVYQILVE